MSALMGLAMVATTSCDDAEYNDIKITYYPQITLDGNSTHVVKIGSPYIDPGYTAIMRGEDVTSQVVVESDVDVDTPGAYTVTYTMTNEDGFSASTSRLVIVSDCDSPLESGVEGDYTTDPASYRLRSGATVKYGDSFDISLTYLGMGIYEVSDLLGGFYCQRAGYGASYNLTGYVSVSTDGSISLFYSYLPGWGDSADALEDAKFDAGTITWDAVYAGMDFNVIMTKN